MLEKGLISIVIPIFKVEKYIRECLESLEKQTYKNFEVFCVDDCGKDNSMKIAQEFADRDERFKIINNPHNLGIGPSRNQGLTRANGEYIFFVDPDDYLIETALEDLHNAIIETDSDIVVTKALAFPDDDSKETIERTKSSNLWLDKKSAYKHKITVSNYMDGIYNFNCTIWGKLYKREFFEKNHIRFINKKVVHEDNGFWLKICACFPILTYLDKVGLMYRIRKNATTDTINKKGNERKKYQQMKINILDAFKFIRENVANEYRENLITQISNSPEYGSYMENNIKFIYRFKWLLNQKYFYLFGMPLYTEKQSLEGIKKRKILGIVIKKMPIEQLPSNINADEIKLGKINDRDNLEFLSNNNDENLKSALNLEHFYFYPSKGDYDNLMLTCAGFQYIKNMNYDIFNVLNFKNYNEPFNLVYGSGNLWQQKYKKKQKEVLNVFKSKLIKKCVILPSYFNNCPELMKVLDERFTVFCQDEESLKYCTEHNNKAKFILSDNILFNANLDIFKTDFYNYNNIENLRTKNNEYLQGLIDKIYPYYSEKVMMILNCISKYEINKVLYILPQNINTEGKNPNIFNLATIVGSFGCDEGLSFALSKLLLYVIDKFSLIVTDKLNIGICAAKLGKQVLFLNNPEISSIYDYTLKNWNNVHITDEKNLLSDIEKYSNNLEVTEKSSVSLPKGINEFLYEYGSFKNKFGIEKRFW